MKRKNLVTWVFVWILLHVSVSEAEITVGDRVTQYDSIESELEIRFEPLEGLDGIDVEPLLINGTPVDPQFFPAVFRMTTGGTCTATLVGPASILLAAHCVANRARISFVAGGNSVNGICEHAPGYQSVDDSQDWAMCLLSNEILGLPYESVDIQNLPSQGETLILTGYGCTRQGGPLDGRLRIGVSKVVGKPTGFPTETSTIYTESDIAAGEAVLCPGDSGGPAYHFTGGMEDKRSIVGVNSRTTFERGVSLMSATASQAGAAFINSWTNRHGQKVCGVNLQVNCR